MRDYGALTHFLGPNRELQLQILDLFMLQMPVYEFYWTPITSG